MLFLDVRKAYDRIEKWAAETDVGDLDQMKDVKNEEVILDGEISRYADLLKGAGQGCTLSPTLLWVFVDDMVLQLKQQSREPRWGRNGIRIDAHR